MGFEISKIVNDKLQKLAEKIDKKNVKDGELDSREFSIFSEKAQKIISKNADAKTEFDRIAGTFNSSSQDEAVGDSFKSTVAATNPQAKTAEELREKFDKVIQIMHGTEAGQAVISANGGDNYKAYLDIVHDEVKHKGWRKDGTKAAYKELKKFVKHQAQEANDDVALGREGATAEVGYGKNKVNKHHEELIEYDKIAARRLEELKKGVTYAEMEEKLGKKLAEKLKPYAEQHKNADGTYDLSGLRTDKMFGADLYKGSDNVVKTHEDPKESERIAMQEGFGLIAGNDKNMFSTGETKDIIEFIGLQNAKRSHNIADAAKDELPGVVAGVIAGMSFWVEQNQNIVINGLTKETANQVASQTGGTATASGGGKFTVKFHQKQAANLFGLAPALATVGLTILLKTILGEEKGERNCFNVKEASYYKTLNELQEFANKKYPEKAEALMTLANYYVQQYNGDEEKGLNKLYDYLNKVHSGINSPMDPDECWMAFKATLPPPPQEETTQQTYSVTDDCKEAERVTTPVTHPEEKGVDWRVMAERYNCLKDYLPKEKQGNGYRAKLVKVMQSVTNDDYSLANLIKLTDIARSIPCKKDPTKMTKAEKDAHAQKIREKFEYEGVQGFDVENYIANFFANTIGKQKVPTIKINETTDCPYNKDITYTVKNRIAKSTGTSSHTGDENVCIKGGNSTATVKTSDGKYSKTVNNQADLNAAVKEVKEAGYKKGNVDTNCYTVE